MQIKKIAISLIIIPLFISVSYSEKPEKDTITQVNNSIFHLPDGKYVIENNNKIVSEIDEDFFQEIINGNIFIIFNWIESFEIDKKLTKIEIKTTHEGNHESSISGSFISIFNKLSGWLSNFIDKQVEIKYSKKITINHKTEKNTIYIKNISGIEIKNNFLESEKIFSLLDVSRYKLIYHKEFIFLGVENSEKPQFFDYYIYTSANDLKNRGFSEVFNQSNQHIRKKLRPMVKNLF